MMRLYEGYLNWMERSDEWWHRSFDNMDVLGKLVLTKDNDCWGDDWNDRPADCNAGPPYDKFQKHEITLRKGMKIKIVVVEQEQE